MKKITYLLMIAGFMMVTFIISCKKDSSQFCVPVRIYVTDSFAYYDLSYEGNYLKSTEYKLKNGRLVQTETYNYTSNERLSSRVTVDSNGTTIYKTEYAYNAQGKVQEEDYYVLSSGTLHKSSYWVYEYNTDGYLSKYTYYINTLPPFVNHSKEFLSYDADGNYTKAIEKNSIGVTVDTIYYTYDNHFGILKTLSPFDPKQSSHNLTEERSRPTGGGSDYTTTNNYLYNSMGYPTYFQSLPDDERLYIEYDCDR